MFFGIGQYWDVTEAIDYIHEQYCAEIDRKIFAIGFSMGGNWLAMAMCKNKHNFKDKIVAAACVHTPMDFKHSVYAIANLWFGFVSWRISFKHKEILRANLNYIGPIFKQKHNIDIQETIDKMNGIHELDLEVNWKVQGYKSVEEYHRALSCSTFMEKIKVPTIFYHSEDDPIVVPEAIEKTKSVNNDYVLMTSTRYGAHLCSHESFFETKQWLAKPVLEFFEYFKMHEIDKPSKKIQTFNI